LGLLLVAQLVEALRYKPEGRGFDSNQNSIQEEIKSRLESGNACYHSVQNILCSGLLFKN
jgi:hypothetical protein